MSILPINLADLRRFRRNILGIATAADPTKALPVGPDNPLPVTLVGTTTVTSNSTVTVANAEATAVLYPAGTSRGHLRAKPDHSGWSQSRLGHCDSRDGADGIWRRPHRAGICHHRISGFVGCSVGRASADPERGHQRHRAGRFWREGA